MQKPITLLREFQIMQIFCQQFTGSIEPLPKHTLRLIQFTKSHCVLFRADENDYAKIPATKY